MKTSILFWMLAGSIAANTLPARAQEWRWAASYGGQGTENVGGLAATKDGGVFLTGSYTATVSIGTNSFRSKGAEDIFLLHANDAGELRWALSMGGGASDFSRGCVADGQKNAYITGTFDTYAWIGGQWMNGVGASDVFLAKYSEDGAALWCRMAGGTGGDEPRMLALDDEGNIVITGVFNSPELTFDQVVLTNQGQGDLFIAKYDPEGALVWAIAAGGTGDDFGTAVAVDAEKNVYVTGGFRGTAWFGANSVASELGAAFLAKFDVQGSNVWVVTSQSDQGLFSTGLAATPEGRTYQTGYFLGNAVLGERTISSSGISDIFLATYTSEGAIEHAERAGGVSMDQAAHAAVDASGTPWITGFIFGNANFGTNQVDNLLQAAFVAKYKMSGETDWVILPKAGLTSEGKLLAFHPPNFLFLAGEYSGSLDLTGTALNSAGGRDVFLTRINLPGGCDPIHEARPLSLRKLDAFSFEITAETESGRAFDLQYSSDMKTWMSLTNFQAESNTFKLTDQISPDIRHRFYRNIQTCR